MNRDVVIPAYAGLGQVLSGLTPAWAVVGGVTAFYNAHDGSQPTPPTFSEPGSNGIYRVTMDGACCGLVDFGVTANPRYYVVEPTDRTVIAAFDMTISPTPGLTLAWASYFDESTGTALLPQATFHELGAGLYRIDGMTGNATGNVDCGSGRWPQFQLVTPVAGPSIANISPADGTTIAVTQSFSFDVPDLTSVVVAVLVWVLLFPPGADRSDDTQATVAELVYDGDGFVRPYRNASALTSSGSTLHFVVGRDNGWKIGNLPVGAVKFRVRAVDAAGAEM